MGVGDGAIAGDGAVACAGCLRRTWLVQRLAGHLDQARGHVTELLALGDEELIDAVGGRTADQVRAQWAAFDPAGAGARSATGVRLVCRCMPGYPSPLHDLTAPPAVLHVVGGGELPGGRDAGPSVAIVGSRRASPYWLEAAHSLARGISAAGLPVVSGMASGVDSAAHAGALEAGGGTIAVLANAPERPYPAGQRLLHRRILGAGTTGLVVSELGPGVATRRWMFPARNRIIAALATVTIVVGAREGSGAILTARHARCLGRAVGAVPGPVSAPLAWGPHELLRDGAQLITGAADVLDLLFGTDREPVGALLRPAPAPALAPLLDAIADGYDPPAAFDRAGLDTPAGIAALAALELSGHLARGAGGRFSIVG